MPELFLELLSEEIPARMQRRGAEDLAHLASDALAALQPSAVRSFSGPRRIALSAELAPSVPAQRRIERGPRTSAPDQALAGFLRKHNAIKDDLTVEGEFWALTRTSPGIDAAGLIAAEMPALLRRFPWPKSMRWGGTSAFTWVRPLRRIVCLLDGAVVPFDLREGEDDGHGLASSNLTEGHRFLSPAAFAVCSCEQWQQELRHRYVITDAAERSRLVATGMAERAASEGLVVVADPGLLDEVAGLVEWPVPLLGDIDPAYMHLPPEVMRVSMRVNQRYFALQDEQGQPSPKFAFVANIEPTDGGAATIAGNERVLRARFADAMHFWNLDRQVRLDTRVPRLAHVTFHAKLGSQGDRVERLVTLAGRFANDLGANVEHSRRAALLCKADLVSGMVVEFPELQGVMGGYYASHDREDDSVTAAIREHYAPKGPSDYVPQSRVSVVLAITDKLDLLASFFSVGEKPTGSSDPYALRRAALGLVRIVIENRLRISLYSWVGLAVSEVTTQLYYRRMSANTDTIETLRESGVSHNWVEELSTKFGGRVKAFNSASLLNEANAGTGWHLSGIVNSTRQEVLEFIIERLRVKLRSEGARHDVLSAVLGAGMDDDLTRLLDRTEAVANFLGTEAGSNLLAAYRRAANILRIEERRDGPHDGPVDDGWLEAPEEKAVVACVDRIEPQVARAIGEEQFEAAMSSLAALRPPLDAFFDHVTVNDARPELRRNRLRLLARVRAAMNGVADFSKIEG